MGDFLNSKADAANYRMQAAQARTQGAVERRQSYAQAYKLEWDSAQGGYVAGDRMMTARQNAVASMAALRAQNGASGLLDAGSKLRVEQSTAEVLDAAIANMGKSYAVQDQNARWQAAELRREGDTAYDLANIQAGYYDGAARAASKAAPWQLLGGAFTLGSQLYNTFNFFGSPAAGSPPPHPSAAGAANPLYVDAYGFVGKQRV